MVPCVDIAASVTIDCVPSVLRFKDDELEHLRQYGRKSLKTTAARRDHPELKRQHDILFVCVQVLLFYH